MEKPQSKYRFERKYVIKPEQYHAFLFELTKSGYAEIYKQRQINNIYLDDYNYTNVLDNVEGISKRTKTRIRWYGEMFSNSKKTVEFKIKSDDVNRKEHIKLSEVQLKSFEDSHTFWDTLQAQMTETKQVKYYTNQLFALQPTLLNSYTRNYFSNIDESVRITIDKDLFYYSPMTYTETNDTNIVVEIKYNAKEILTGNLLSHLALTKHSKYIKGILMTSTFKAIY